MEYQEAKLRFIRANIPYGHSPIIKIYKELACKIDMRREIVTRGIVTREMMMREQIRRMKDDIC